MRSALSSPKEKKRHRQKMRTVRPSMLLIFFILFFMTYSAISVTGQENQVPSRTELVWEAGYGEDKLSSVLVTGSVFCESCHKGKPQSHALHVKGALVAVTCKTGHRMGKLHKSQAITDEYSDFIIDLPSILHAIPNLHKSCMVRVLRLPKHSPCRQSFTRKARRIELSSVGNGIRTYTTGVIKFKRQSKPWNACIRKGGGIEDVRSW